MGARTDLSLVAMLVLAACAKPTEVELRLTPCGSPVSVELDVQGYDAAGTALAPLHETFAILDPGVFGDGYATVGLRKPDGMVTADFTLTWHGADEVVEVVTLTAVKVPAPGEVLPLGADDCVPVDAGTTSTGSTGDPSTGPGTSSSGGEPSSSGGATSTGSTTGTTADGTTTGTTAVTTEDPTTEDTSSTGDTTTGEPTVAGMPCVGKEGVLYCEHSGPGKVGDVLKCMGEVWTWVEPEAACILAVYCPTFAGHTDPKAVGCSGDKEDMSCVCEDQPPDPCDNTEIPCDGARITLCIDDGMGTKYRTIGQCLTCDDSVPGMPVCGP